MRWTATATLLLLLLAGVAGAETCKTSALVPPTATDWSRDLQLEPFDTSLGALTAVHFSVEGQFDGEFFHENTGTSPVAWQDVMNWNLDVSMDRAQLPRDVILFDDEVAASGRLGTFDGAEDYAGTSGVRHEFMTPISGGIVISGAGLDDFIGVDKVVVHLDARGHADLMMGGLGLLGSKSSCTAKVTLTYEYTTDAVADEPASWSRVKSLYR